MKKFKRFGAVLLTLAVMSSAMTMFAFGEEGEPADESAEIAALQETDAAGEEEQGTDSENTKKKTEEYYYEYYDEYNAKAYTGKDLVFSLVDIVEDKSTVTSDIKNADDGKAGPSQAVRLEVQESISFKVTVPKTAVYYPEIEYCSASDDPSTLQYEMSVLVNGIYPYYDLRRIVLHDKWLTDYSAESQDRYGNDIIRVSKRENIWQTSSFHDSSWHFSETLGILLEEGENTISFSANERPMYFNTFTLKAKEELPAYENPGTPDKNVEAIVKEAEEPDYKNDNTIRQGTTYDMDVTPHDNYKTKMNIIEGGSFFQGGQMLTYKVDVKEAGPYYLAFNYRQSTKNDAPAFRDVLIDGEIPYKEFRGVTFAYSSSYTTWTLSDSKGNEMPVYLSEGEHTISLRVNLEPFRDAVYEIDKIINEITDFAFQVQRLVGTTEDTNRDFEIEKYMPDIKEQLEGWADRLEEQYKKLCTLNPDVDEIGEYSTFMVAARSLRRLAQKPNQIPPRIKEISGDSGSVLFTLTEAYTNLNKSPVELDKVILYTDKSQLSKRVPWYERIGSSFSRFFASFFKQSYTANSAKDSDRLQVWVNRSRQYVQTMQIMVDNQFTKETGIEVDLSLMPDQNKLVLANASGKSPDVAASIGMGIPYELGLRGTLKDLSEFEGFQEVANRVQAQLFVPGIVEDAVYAMPETWNFYATAYRTDIFERFNIDFPEEDFTWDDVRNMLPELQRRGMNFFSHISSLDIAMKPYSSTLPFIYQHGGDVYDGSPLETYLNSDPSLAGLKEATELFSIYNLPYETPSFYQHFRDGSFPIGIMDFGTYVQTLYAAPEIANSWALAPYPAVENRETGEKLRWVNGAAEGLVIFESSTKQEEAWKYIEWWTRAETQLQFSNTMQATYGKEYMWNTANIEAFKDLPWKREHKQVIGEMMNWVRETPKVPGSYMIERELSNVYNKIVLKGENPRAALNDSLKIINREIERKMEEFGYMKNGEVIKDYKIPTIDNIEDWIEKR